ncbi:MAG: IscS subfamily cysteine desulfurase [Chitinophagaceae bacterium]|nr:MAG: IscS subfamily cysteine desulfurase [Chitinophagaceae bacterium]
MDKAPIYLDNNATTSCDPRVVEAMLPYFSSHFGNAASRTHLFGWQAEESVDLAREQVAALLGCDKQEIIFTSGATESDNLAIKGVFETYTAKGKHIITCVAEHSAVLDTCRHLEKLGAEVTYLPVNHDGLIDIAALEQAIRPDTILLAIMFANNETGVLQPIGEIGAIAKKHQVLFFTDATQAVGKIPVDVRKLGIDLLALSAHKMYGPKGVGALYIRRRDPRVKLVPQLHGGGHERGNRSGTLNVPGIVGLGKACQLCSDELQQDATRLSGLRDQLEHALLTVSDSQVNGANAPRLPQTTNLSFRQVDSQVMMMGFSAELAISSGSACSSATLEPSHVLRAMGLTDELALSSVRFGLGRFTTQAEIDRAIGIITQAVNKLRQAQALS